MTPTTAAAMGSVPIDKAGVGSGGAEQHAPGGRRARHRRHGRHHRRFCDRCSGDSEATEGFVTGYQHALEVAAAIALVGAILSVATVRKYRHVEEPILEGA